MLFHTSLGPLFTRSTFSVSLSISLCTESNFEQGAVCTESSLGYIEMQRDCIIGWKDNSKLDDPNRFVMVFFFPFRGYQTREVAGTRNTVLHIILIRRDTFIYIYIYIKTGRKVFFIFIFSKTALIQRVIRRGRKKPILYALRALLQHPKNIQHVAQLFAESRSPPSLPPLNMILASSSIVRTELNKTMWGGSPLHIWQHLFTLALRSLIKHILANTEATHKCKPGGDWGGVEAGGQAVHQTVPVYNLWHVQSPRKPVSRREISLDAPRPWRMAASC